MTNVAKLDFGEPGVHIQEGFYKLGLPDGGEGTFNGTFPCEDKTCHLKISGYTHTRYVHTLIFYIESPGLRRNRN